MPINGMMDDISPGTDLKVRFIPGAPPGVCAAPITVHPGESWRCEECPKAITESDGEVWFCDAGLLKKRRGGGLCFWHYDCLTPATPSIAVL